MGGDGWGGRSWAGTGKEGIVLEETGVVMVEGGGGGSNVSGKRVMFGSNVRE